MKAIESIGNNTRLFSDESLKYIQFECFDKYSSSLRHCVSTRHGGVSEGECSSLNLGFNRNDSRENVKRNFEIICDSVGIDCESLVLTNQVHDNKIKVISSSDKGKGFSKESDIKGIDGFVTNEKGITMVAFYADCVPVLLYDDNKKVAALLHSGWKSTYKGISAEAVKIMREDFKCRAEDITAAIGPSIHKCCFEVGEDVYDLFIGKYKDRKYYSRIGSGKWRIDLQGIIEDTMLECGLSKQNIQQSNICTKCRKDLFFSYRGDSGRTGSLAAFMQIY